MTDTENQDSAPSSTSTCCPPITDGMQLKDSLGPGSDRPLWTLRPLHLWVVCL
uniref:Uncharacterized protein n=1 Tax=Piliocolobus tephrosceles TaxID=591936 RepID=A0A8C9I526_9PRIM